MKKNTCLSLICTLIALSANAATEQPGVNSAVSPAPETILKSNNKSGATIELLSGVNIPLSGPDGYNPENSLIYGLGGKYRINRNFNVGARWLTSKVYSTFGSYSVWGIGGNYSIDQFVSIYAVTAEYSPISNLYFGGMFGPALLSTKVAGSGANSTGSFSGSAATSSNGTAVGAYVGYDIHVAGSVQISPQLNFTQVSAQSIKNFTEVSARSINIKALGALATLKYNF